MRESAAADGKGAIRVGVSARKERAPRRRAYERRGGVVRYLLWLGFVGASGSPAVAGVDLLLETRTPQAGVDATVEVRLMAKSTSATPEAISGLDAILTWEPGSLELLGARPGDGYAWLLSGLFNDALADGLNNTYEDGNAYYQALSQFVTPAVATVEGLHVATFQFRALKPVASAEARLVKTLGGVSRTRVFRFGAVSQDIVSGLGSVQVRILRVAVMEAADVSVVAGRSAQAWVFGGLEEGMTFGVTVMSAIEVLGPGDGVVEFTPAPPVDVLQLGDPWPGVGTFTAFDTNTDAAAAPLLNGSVDDNGSFVPVLLTFDGPLSAFPVRASVDATGERALRLATAQGASHWEGIATALRSGVIRVVAVGDGDGDSFVDLRDWSELQNCYTGGEGGTGARAYSEDPRRRCGVYDFDDDHDVDGSDFAAFAAVLNGSEN